MMKVQQVRESDAQIQLPPLPDSARDSRYHVTADVESGILTLPLWFVRVLPFSRLRPTRGNLQFLPSHFIQIHSQRSSLC